MLFKEASTVQYLLKVFHPFDVSVADAELMCVTKDMTLHINHLSFASDVHTRDRTTFVKWDVRESDAI